jgi:alpha-D-xyloside xylohydrolase
MNSRKFIFILSLAALLHLQAAATIKSYKETAAGLNFLLDKGSMQLNILAPDIIEVKYSLFDSLPAKESLVVEAGWPVKKNFTVTEEGNSIVIRTGRLKLTVDRATNAIAYEDPAGHRITSEAGTDGKRMSPATIAGIDTYNCETQFNSPVDEALYGLGCHPLDSLSINYKGRNQELAIKYMTGAIPVLLSTRGFGLMWDNYSASSFYGGEAGNTRFKFVSESGKAVDYYFFYGPDFDHIIDLYRQLTGTAPMFPKWAFGLFQSQDRYKSQQEILSVKDNYRNRHIPVDVIVQDWYYWSPRPIGSHLMNAERYPDPAAMLEALHKAHIHGMISIWPVFGSGTSNFTALKNIGGLTGITWDNFVTHTFDTYYDAYNPKARELYWQQAKDSLIARYGWDAWWIDQCEPDNGELLDLRKQNDFYSGKGIDYFNSYSLEHTKGVYEGWRRDIPGKRAFFLARQSFAGGQRNASTLWSSDITSTFASFRNQVPQGINACASGIPYWTSDIGGYISHTDKDGIPDWTTALNRELFTRWFQFGTFCPVFRIHGKGERALFSDNWDEQTKGILLNYDRLRYRLLPYIYSLAGKVTQQNYTMMRALGFDFRDDPRVYAIQDQYMFGPAFLVSPVTAPSQISRKVYLPAPGKWYDFWTGRVLNGGQSIDAAAPISVMPLYIRAGSILPMGPVMEYATEKPADTLELRIYPGADGQFTLYEDENDSYNYEKKEFATIQFAWNEAGRELTIGSVQGSFPGMLKQRIFNIVIVKEGLASGIGPAVKFDRTIRYDGKQLKLVFAPGA